MPNRHFSQHFREKMIHVAASARCFQVRQVFFLGCGQIQSVKMRIIKKVPLDSPHFMEHLIPLRARVHVRFHGVKFQLPFARLRRSRSRRDKPRCRWPRSLPVQCFFAIRGDGETADTGDERLRFSGG